MIEATNLTKNYGEKRAVSDISFEVRPGIVTIFREGGALTFPQPTDADDVAYAVESAVLDEAYIVRAQRRLDALEQRLEALES